jgi:uncharacterized membrane protein YgdD (TMEM256/DUF423 family)
VRTAGLRRRCLPDGELTGGVRGDASERCFMTLTRIREKGRHAIDMAPPEALRPAARLWLFLGGLNGFLSVAAGAYGRHGALEQAGREMIGIASNYQMAHGLGLLAVAWLASRHEGGWLTAPNLAGAAFTLGILLFSGSLYWFGLTGLVPVEGSAPAGGFLLMFGWLAAMWTAIRHRR